MVDAQSIWLAAGLRTPFAKIDAQLAGSDVFGLSVPVVQSMLAKLQSGRPDFVVWGSVVPNLGWSNLAREVCLEAKSAAWKASAIPRSVWAGACRIGCATWSRRVRCGNARMRWRRCGRATSACTFQP